MHNMLEGNSFSEVKMLLLRKFILFVIGTNLGAALVDLETGRASWLLRSKSDVLAQQLVHSVIY